MNNYQFYQAMRQGLGQQQRQKLDSSQVDRELPPSSYNSEGSITPSQYPEHAKRPFPSETDYSESTAVSSGSGDYAHERPSSHHQICRDGPFNISTDGLIENTRKRNRGRQTEVVKQKKQAAANRRANAPPSKASIKRAELIATHGAHMIGADEELKGETRPRADGFFDWKEPGTGKWLPAAPHDWFRQDFINIDHTYAPYLKPPDRGIHDLDITSHCSALGQNTWNFDPEGWDNIVDGEGNKVMFLNKAPARFQEYPQGSYWCYKELIMLDPDDRPVLNWTSIPMVFSSKLEGGRMEALKRVFPWLKNADFRARMPRMVQTSQRTFNPLPKYSTFSQRLSRFRYRTRCAPWTERAGTRDRWERKLRDLSEDASDGEDTTMDGSSLGSEGEGNGCAMKQHAVKGSAVQPWKRQRISSTPVAGLWISGLQGMQSSRSPQNNQRIEPFAAQMTQATPCLPWPYDGRVYPPVDAPDRPGVSPYYQPLGLLPARSSHKQSNQLDLRFTKPQTTADDLNIKTALHVTRADFRSRYNFDAPITPNGESYYIQYQIIQAKHAELWVVDDNPPSLIGIGTWYGSFETWPTPHLSQEDLQRLLITSEASQTGIFKDTYRANTDLAAWDGVDADDIADATQ